MPLEAYLGQLMLVPYTFAPKNWADCNGQILQISQNTALFSLLGTTYGGNGSSTFGLPDLRGRVPICVGQGPGLSPIVWGEKAGTPTVTLQPSELPTHSHVVRASSARGSTADPTNAFFARPGAGRGLSAYDGTASSSMASTALNATGGSQPHNNMQPYLVLRWVICTSGIFPSRN